MIQILEEYEIIFKHHEYTKIVNNLFYLLTEAFILIILELSSELIKQDIIKFREFLNDLNFYEQIFQNLNQEFSLYNKEIIIIQILNKIKNSYISNKYTI